MAVAVVCIDIYNKSTKKRSPSYFYSFLFWCNNMNMNNNSDCRQTFATISREKHIVYTTYADCSSEWNPFKNIKKRLFQSFVELWKMINAFECTHAFMHTLYIVHIRFLLLLWMWLFSAKMCDILCASVQPQPNVRFTMCFCALNAGCTQWTQRLT